MKYIRSEANISDDGVFRFTLSRTWDGSKGTCMWIMLNPSTADSNSDDPTIRKCVGFADRWGYGSIMVANLFAYRTSSPAKLKAAGYPMEIGVNNNKVIHDLLPKAAIIVAAWGAHAPPWRDFSMRRLIYPHKAYCLGLTKAGLPKHPLLVPYSQELCLLQVL